MLRSAPVEVLRLITPAPEIEDAVWPLPVVMVAAPEALAAFLTPLARSIAVRTSPTVAVEVVLLAPMKIVELPEPSVTMLPDKPEPEATADVAGAGPPLKGKGWPLEGELSPPAAGGAPRT